MFFLTEQDPNYRIKGSRDPLGFQPIWQSLGRTVVKYLSTVSGNIKDFQILAYAWYFYGDKDSKGFLPFFYKFEQAYGFARGEYIKSDAFNGIDFVRKNLDKEVFSFSNQAKDTILSNQKSYGIFGKYNRPFTEMRIKEQTDFREIMESSLREKVNFDEFKTKVDILINKEIVEFSKTELKIFADSIASLTSSEKSFYTKHILQSDVAHVQNELFSIFNLHSDLTKFENFNLYAFMDALRQKSISIELSNKIDEIEKSEKVLTPFVYLFKMIQSSPKWKINNLENEPIFNSFPKAYNHTFKIDIVNNLNLSLSKEPSQQAIEAVKRNKAVSENRGNSVWIKQDGNELITYYADGSRHIEKFNNDTEFEHNYFLPTYISMYKQIMGTNA
jgi:hypothetical protein